MQDEDWRAYSTEEDALEDVNAWATCDYSERTKRGFPGDCGPVGAELLKWISKTGCSPSASPDAALYIYAPAAAATAQPEKFRGLSSKIAAAHGHLLDGEGLDVITKDDHVGYIPWYGLGVSQHAPAATWEHAAEYILAGASAVQVGTATFVDPTASVAMADGLRRWADGEGVGRLSDLVGAIRTD